jgi:hypothetical protein
MVKSGTMKKWLYWAAFLSLGPITGPLAEGIVRNLRKGERPLAALYGLAVVTSYMAMTLAAAHMMEFYFG